MPGAGATATSSCSTRTASCAGKRVVDLVKLMEAHPHVGLIQTVPALVNAESLFGRIQQFANRLYAPVFIAGLNLLGAGFRQLLGAQRDHPHRAVHADPAICRSLPGRKPFGGQILSHDFVEAALLLKENWQVWFAHELEGSYEESPQDIVENARRDRRLVPGQPAARNGVVCAGPARRSAGFTCSWASSATWPARSGCCSSSRSTGCSGTGSTPAFRSSPCAPSPRFSNSPARNTPS